MRTGLERHPESTGHSAALGRFAGNSAGRATRAAVCQKQGESP
jgi:hypothetical protein